MNVFQFPCVCDVCDGEGDAKMETFVSQLLGGKVRHTNPEICADNLTKRQRAIETKEKELGMRLS